MPKAIPASAIMAAADMSTSPRAWPLSRAKTSLAGPSPPPPGDTFMGLGLAAGGHLTHGHPANYSGKWFKPVPYTVRRDDQRIDMDQVRSLAREHKPKLILAGGSAYARIIDFAAFRDIVDELDLL